MLIALLLRKPKVRTRNTKPLAAVGFSRFDMTWQEIFLNFQEHFLCIYRTLVFNKCSSQFYNSRLLLHVKEYLRLIFCLANTNHIRHSKPPTVCHLHVNIRLMSIISQSAFLIWNTATIATLQYSIWKWNFDSNNAESHSQIISGMRWVFRL